MAEYFNNFPIIKNDYYFYNNLFNVNSTITTISKHDGSF